MTSLTLFDRDQCAHIYKVSETLAKSNIVPLSFRGKTEDVFACVLMGAELGLSPLLSLSAIVMIQGQVTLKASTMMAIIRAKAPNAYIKIELDSKNLVAKCICARDKDSIDEAYESVWDMRKAEMMGLSGKDNYKKQPLNMLKWRATSEALRYVFGDLLLGLYATEELIDAVPTKAYEIYEEKAMLEQDFPIPPEEKEIGPLYRIQNAKYRGKQLKDISVGELVSYRNELMKREKKKTWEQDLVYVLSNYIESQSNKIEEGVKA